MKRREKILRPGKSRFYREFMKNLIEGALLILFLLSIFVGIVRALLL